MSRGLVNKSTGERIPSAPGYIVDKVGDLSALHTTAKDKAVSAINEVADAVNAVESALVEKADTDIVAADFNAGTSYTAGNYCVQDGKLYRFKNNHSGAWSASDVEEVKIAGELSSLESGLINIGALYHSEFYTDTEVANENVINSITIAKTGKYLIMSYIKGQYCWLQKGTSYYPNVRLRNEDGTSYVTFDTLTAGDVIKQVNASGSAQTYIVSELKAVRIA